MAHRTVHVTYDQIKKAIEEYSPYLSKAAYSLGISYDTFRRRAKEFNLYTPNRAFSRKTLSKYVIQECIDKTCGMPEAAKMSGISYAAFKRHAIGYGIWKPSKTPNKGRKCVRNKAKPSDILSGKHPTMSGSHIKNILIASGHFKLECSVCSIVEWQGKPAPLQLDHINGNRQDHRENNIRLLCPNCHAQTNTYTGRNKFYKNMDKTP